MRRSEFNTLINRDDEIGMHSIGRALVHLFNRQMSDEQVTNDAKYQNNIGFTASDAKRGCITAKYYLKHRTLQDWQIEYWRETDRRGTSRLGKYYRQIAEEAKKKKLKVNA